ncbi:hypothetical protein FB461_0479 [Rarobacter faecitabidus]|uniref:Uncharacterized protein n=1 Tax=Rarobacter faecitabidus TaxID=13243 RepID=A0A542ZUQ8_RARFA|nr:hypothetical protein FB461_0479 [Rarobacter faecitabidus]
MRGRDATGTLTLLSDEQREHVASRILEFDAVDLYEETIDGRPMVSIYDHDSFELLLSEAQANELRAKFPVDFAKLSTSTRGLRRYRVF